MIKKLLYFFLLTITTSGILWAQSPQGENFTGELPLYSDKALEVTPTVELYPNPTTEFLNIKLENFKYENVEFELFNIIGNSLPIEVEEIGTNRFRIPVKKFTSGYYLLIISDKDKKYTSAFKFQKR